MMIAESQLAKVPVLASDALAAAQEIIDVLEERRQKRSVVAINKGSSTHTATASKTFARSQRAHLTTELTHGHE